MKRGLEPAEYKAFTRAIFKRDGWKCRRCKSRNNLHCHHMVFRSHGGLDTTTNCITVCNCCHDDIHKGKRDKRLTVGGDANGTIKFTWIFYEDYK